MNNISSDLFNLFVFTNWGSLTCLLGSWQEGTDAKDRGVNTVWCWSLCCGIHERVRAKVGGGEEVLAAGGRLARILLGKISGFHTARDRDWANCWSLKL